MQRSMSAHNFDSSSAPHAGRRGLQRVGYVADRRPVVDAARILQLLQQSLQRALEGLEHAGQQAVGGREAVG